MKSVARAIIHDDQNRVLLAKRARGNGAGQWALLGGKPDPGESGEEAIIREIKEEADIDFQPSLFKEEMDATGNPEGEEWKVWYFAGPATGTIKLHLDENSEYRYVSPEDIQDMDLAFGHTEILEEWWKRN